MKTSNSLLQDLLQALPRLRPQIYYKASLTALSHAMEDLILVGIDKPLVIANFQQERFYRQESRRYERIAQRTDMVYVLATPESDFIETSTPFATIPLDPEDGLAQEWHLIIIGEKYAACIVALEFASPVDAALLDQTRQFKGIWSFERQVSTVAAQLLLNKILVARPQLSASVKRAQKRYGLTPKAVSEVAANRLSEIDARLFTDRLVTYLQSSQYKQLPLVQADGEGLIEVLTKLLDNACKFSNPDGKVTIQAQVLNPDTKSTSQRQPSLKKMLQVIIADTGRGIEPNQLEAIFQRFYQQEGFLRRTIGGTGLGLAICRQIIQRLGGEIWAISAGKNQGSQFYFTLPIVH